MREVYSTGDLDLGVCFYTIRQEDVGRTVIRTEAGPIHMVSVIGKIMEQDVGKRLWRIPTDDGGGWHWLAETAEMRDRRLARQREVNSG